MNGDTVPELGTVYLAGPMSDLPFHNYPLFDEVTSMLRQGGWDVLSPAEMNRQLFPDCENEPGFAEGKSETADITRRYAVMKDDIHAVLVADSMALLPGWERSTGATIERAVAEACGKPIFLVVPGEMVELPIKFILVHDPVQVRMMSGKMPGTDILGDLLEEIKCALGLPHVHGGNVVTKQPQSIDVEITADTSQAEAAFARVLASLGLVAEYADDLSRGAESVTEHAHEGDGPANRTRTFETGATRDDDTRKHDYEGFLSIPALRAYGRYMQTHAIDPDGNARASDNWQQGIPNDALMKSLLRHVFDVWELMRTGQAVDFDGVDISPETAICGVLFNAFALLHNLEVQQ